MGYIRIKEDKHGEYFRCEECGKKVYLDDENVTSDKWWDDEGNHRMLYICPNCDTTNFE